MAYPKKVEEYSTPGKSSVYVGTPDYSSARALRCFLQAPRDDLESLGYAMYELWHGE